MSRWPKKEDEVQETNSVQSVKETIPASEPVKQAESQGPMVLVSEMDAYVHERLKSQPKTFEEISIKSDKERSEGGHVLRLPDEILKYQPKFSFRWLNKKKRSIDNALDVIGWSLVNKVLFKDLPNHLFTANGVIERGYAILAFMPQQHAERIRKRPGELSRERVKETPVQDLKRWKDRGDRYYKPDLGSAESEDDSEYSKGNKGLVVQLDEKTE